MRDGFIRVACAYGDVVVADPLFNADSIIEIIDKADKSNVNLLVFPELAISGCSSADLFLNDTLQNQSKKQLLRITEFTRGLYPVVVIGVPIFFKNKIFDCAAVIYNGEILGVVPKTGPSKFGGFSTASELGGEILHLSVGNKTVPFGANIIFEHNELSLFKFGVEIGDDLMLIDSISSSLCRNGASIIVNTAAFGEDIGADKYLTLMTQSASSKCISGYVLANAPYSESTQECVYSGHHIICENGTILRESKPFSNDNILITEIDVNRLAHDRIKSSEFSAEFYNRNSKTIFFNQNVIKHELTRKINKNPFVPNNKDELDERCEKILNIQSYGLKKRIEHAHANTVVIGISGGLDSTLALLVCVRAMDLLKRSRKDIIAVTMPGFGTTKRTKSNAVLLCEGLGISVREISIENAVRQHFVDIGHEEAVKNVTYENAQARERTQILMDIANQTNGIVVGTGDLSELALGWATYNGDHMSMYAVNASVPKTLIYHIVRYEAENCDKKLNKVLLDILDTPVSPELLPADEKGNISQKTEDLVGPYELHDFFLYYFVRFGFSPKKIFNLALNAYKGLYDSHTILKWLKIFLRRFFTQQFKRSCMPDGVKVGTVSLSPRGDWNMPSDASYNIWINELEDIN